MTVTCVACALKHLQSAKTYAKEIMESGEQIPIKLEEIDRLSEKLLTMKKPPIPTVDIKNLLNKNNPQSYNDNFKNKNTNNDNANKNNKKEERRSDEKMALKTTAVKVAGLSTGIVQNIVLDTFVPADSLPAPFGFATQNQVASYALSVAELVVGTKLKRKIGATAADFLVHAGINGFITRLIADIKNLVAPTPTAVKIKTPVAQGALGKALVPTPRGTHIF